MKNVGKILTQILELFFPKLNSRRQNLISDITDNYLHAHPRDIFFFKFDFHCKKLHRGISCQQKEYLLHPDRNCCQINRKFDRVDFPPI